MTTRREFLQYSAAGLLLAGVPALAACHGERRDGQSSAAHTGEAIRGLEADEVEILRLASLAPSGHNTQPWSVRAAGPKHWVLGSDKSLWLPAVDPDNRELLLSLGAFLQNLVVAARTYGYATEIKILATSPTDADIADIRLTKGKPMDFPLDRLKRRRTVRNGFSAEPIKTEDLRFVTRHDEEMCVLSKAPSTHAFFFPNASAQGKTLQEGTIEANRVQAFRDPAQEELSRWIRWSSGDARRLRNGLTPESMEISGFAGWYVRSFYDSRSVLKKGFREQTVDMVKKQVKTCGGWLVVTSLDSDVPTLIAYGMAFERLCLKVRERGIGLHPMTQMIEEQERMGGDVAGKLGLTGRVQWILRMGYLKSCPEPVSVRRPVSWFVRS